MAGAIRDGLRLEAIAADIAVDGDTALELLSVNAYDIAVLDRDIPGPTMASSSSRRTSIATAASLTAVSEASRAPARPVVTCLPGTSASASAACAPRSGRRPSRKVGLALTVALPASR
jgi:hypothetical protein